jgi:hypothetical protein
VETQRHIRNARAGAEQAEKLLAGGNLDAVARFAPEPRPAVTAPVRRVAATKPAIPQPVGTIEWSGSGTDADARRAGKHTVWSNGTVTREGGRVRWTSSVPAPERTG